MKSDEEARASMPTGSRTTSQSHASVLVVFPWCLDQLGHGNIQRVLGYARYLVRKGVDVDLVYQGDSRTASRETELTGFRRVLRVTRGPSSDDQALAEAAEQFYRGLPAPSPNLTAGGAFTLAVRGLMEAIDYTAVISSYTWTAPIFEPLEHRALRICDTHDVLYLHSERSQHATGSPMFEMAPATERFLWRKWDVLLAITREEARCIATSLRPTQHLLTTAHAVSLLERAAPTGNHVVYTGSDNPSNREAMRWLLQEVWPHVLNARPHARLRIVGLIGNAMASTPPATIPSVEIAGFVERPADELRAGAIVVAPYVYGSGLKVKILEAAAAARPIVTTSFGLEGTGMTPGRHLLVEDEPAAFAQALVRLLDDGDFRHTMGAAARGFVERTFSEDACYGPLLDLLNAQAETPVLSGVLSPGVGRYLRAALDALQSPTVVVWGNGSHSRALMQFLQAVPARVRSIVDKNACDETTSPEGVRVVPASQFTPAPNDLVVLSSQLYEAEMWRDLESIRAKGTHVTALYRVDFVTDRLRDTLRRSGGRLPRASSSRPGRRLIVVEPSAGRGHGPFLRLARAMRDASAARTDVIVAGSRIASLDGLEPQDRELLDQAFEFAHWDALHEMKDDAWAGISRYARYLALDLERMGGRLETSGDDIVLFHTANVIEILGAAHWLGTLRPERVPSVRFLFHFTPEQEARWLNLTDAEVRHAYVLALALVGERTGDRLRLLAQTSDLAVCLERALGRTVDPIGFPIPARLRAASRLVPEPPARLLYAGEARSDKGFGMLPAVADELARELADGCLTLVCQSMRNDFADDAIHRAAASLRARRGVEVIDRFLPSAEYDNLVASCDLVLLPYDAQQYRTRLSAVFVDATCAGVLPIVPSLTWMSQQLAEGYGVGTTFDTLDPRCIAAGVREVLRSLPELKQAGRRAVDRVWSQHDPSVVLETILAQ